MHGRYYLLKAGVIVMALVTIGMNAGPATWQVSGEVVQAHAATLHFVEVTAATVQCSLSMTFQYLLHLFV